MKATLIYLLAGALHSQPMPSMPECIVAMENLPFIERARARCETKGSVVHWKDVRPMVEDPKPAKPQPVNGEYVEGWVI